MSKIAVAIYDAQNLISLDGIEAMLLLKEDFEVTGKFSSCQEVIASLRTTVMNVLIVTLYTMKEEELALIKKIRDEHPNIRVLVLAMEHDKSLLFRIIKTGAKGYLTPNAQRQEIYEAILSLRGGYEYYSKTITDLLLKGYIDIIQGDDDKQRNTKNLSTREIEILKYWGDGLTNIEMAEMLHISIRTVESHKNHIMQKLNLKTTVDLIKFAIKNNIIKV